MESLKTNPQFALDTTGWTKRSEENVPVRENRVWRMYTVADVALPLHLGQEQSAVGDSEYTCEVKEAMAISLPQLWLALGKRYSAHALWTYWHSRPLLCVSRFRMASTTLNAQVRKAAAQDRYAKTGRRGHGSKR